MSVKQVIVWRKDLKVRTGKIVAQCCHSSIAWLTNRIRDSKGKLELSPAEEEWVNGLFSKVVLQVENEKELREIYQKALDAGLESHLIIDAGLTEFKGIPTTTCCGIGPDEAEKIDAITGHLKLY